jgi:hypothetical protein
MVNWSYAANAVGENSADNAFNSSAVAGNEDGSILERLEHLQANSLRLVRKTVTFTAAAYEINTAVAVFTVTGDVAVRVCGRVTTAVEADAGADGTISLGVEDNVAILAPVVICNETNFAAGDIWADATTTKEADVMENGGNLVVIGNGEDIEINVLVEDITAGVMQLYCEWKPLSTDGSVVAV